MSKRVIKFFVRIFPLEKGGYECIHIENDEKTLLVRNVLDFDPKRAPRKTFWQFPTDGIFLNVCQDNFYKKTCEDVIDSAFNGMDSIILACGQSSTGKTYSLTGLQGKYEYRGIVPRLIGDIFTDQKARASLVNSSISISIVEAADKHLYDLLAEPASQCSDFKKYKKVCIKSSAEALRYVFDAEHRRKIENRSTHCGTSVTTIYLNCTSLVKSDAHEYYSKIHIIDTAGLDTIWKKHMKTQICQASANTNKCFLEQFFVAMKAEKFSLKSNRRKCELVKYLSDSLPNCHLRLLAHVRPACDDLDVTTSTLKFCVTVKAKCPRVNLVCYKRSFSTVKLNNLEDELNQLRDDILLGRMLNGEYQRSIISRDQMEHVKRIADLFLRGEASEKCVLAVVEPTLFLTVLREEFQQQIEGIKNEFQMRLSENEVPVSTTAIKRQRSKSIASKRESEAHRRGTQGSRKSIAASFGRQTGAARSSKPFILMAHPQSQRKDMRPQPEPVFSVTSMAPDRAAIWTEYSQKCPDIVTKSSNAMVAMLAAKNERDELMMKVVDLIEQIDTAKRELEYATYDRLSTVGNKVGPDGALYESKEEIEKTNQLKDLQIALEQSKDNLESIHRDFVEKHIEFLRARTAAETGFQEYCSTVYITVLAPPELEEPKAKYEYSISEDPKGDPEEKLFKHLQRCHKKTTPYLIKNVQ